MSNSEDEEVQVDDYDDMQYSRGSSQDRDRDDDDDDDDDEGSDCVTVGSGIHSLPDSDHEDEEGGFGGERNGASAIANNTATTAPSGSIGEAILNDVRTSHLSAEQRANAEATKGKATDCCVCGTRALYTCPGCGRRTCSMTCVRVHKTDFNCSGERDVAAKIALADFTDQQLERDFKFLEDCRRVVDNVERSFPRSMWRFNYKALPPPLHALREAARRRGVVCQITSEGMRKRDENTSRLDRKTNTIVWRCEFQFVDVRNGEQRTTVISSDWGSERHRLGDILKYCWATNPPLLCYHINRQYNRASKYLAGGEANSAAEKQKEKTQRETSDAHAGENEGADAEDGGAEGQREELRAPSSSSPAQEASPTLEQTPTVTEARLKDDDAVANKNNGKASLQIVTPQLVPLRAYEEAPPMPPIEPVSPEEAQQQAFVNAFLSAEPYVILSKAERLGTDTKYFQLKPHETLNENLRLLFFVNEFPVFVVVHASQLPHFPLVTEEDKEMIRDSFRPKRTREVRERAPLRRRSDIDPEELERLSKVPCRRFLHSRCQLGEECPYWHCTPEEIPVCRTFLRTGQCDKGPRCSFRHDAEAVRIARRRQRDGVDGGGAGRGEGRGRGGGRGFRGGRGGGFRGLRGPQRRLE